jgi:transcription initiation factor TFIIIB Brf1 subunit/transcription initiation factor TFIIB
MKTADNFRDKGICEGKRPNTIAGASILMIASIKKIDLDIEDIARQVKIGSQAIRECRDQAQPHQNSLLPPQLL